MCGKVLFGLVWAIFGFGLVNGNVQVFNHPIDEIIGWTNGNTSAKENVPDLNQLALPLSFFGVKVPFLRVWLSASGGTRSNVNTLKRVSDATVTTANHQVALDTKLVYDDIELSFEKINADFWYMQTTGGLKVSVPSTNLDVTVTHSGDQCTLKVNSLSYDPLSINVDASNVLGKILGPLLKVALSDNEGSAILAPLKSQIDSLLTSHFADAFCQKAGCLDFWES